MNKKKITLFLLLSSAFIGGLQATFISILEQDIVNFSLFLFNLGQNIVRVERYNLNELKSDINYISKKMSFNHCSHLLYLSDQGLRVDSMSWNEENPQHFSVMCHRGKHEALFTFNWAKLLLTDAGAAQEFMHADTVLEERVRAQEEDEAAFDSLAVEDNASEMDLKKRKWNAFVTVSWGLTEKKVTKLAFEHSLQNVVAVVVPNALCKEFDTVSVMKRQDLAEAGLLSNIKRSYLLQDEDELEAEEEAVVDAVRSKAVDVDVDQNAHVVEEQKSSWLTSWYYALVNVLSQMKKFVTDSVE